VLTDTIWLIKYTYIT